MASRGRPRKAPPAVATPRKRAASPEANPSTPVTALRQSKRAKTTTVSSAPSTATLKKSQYFEHDPVTSGSEASSAIDNEESGYEDEDPSASALSSPPESEEEDEEDEDEDDYGKARGRRKSAPSNKNTSTAGAETGLGRGRVSAAAEVNGNGHVAKKGEELWRPNAKINAKPGEEVFIKLPKARQPGNTPYKDHTIHPNTMLFLGDLKKNNDREWLKIHDADYRQSKKDFDSFIESLTEKIIEKDETIPELPPKDVTFRIYRDIRFSPDPTPYKPYFSAAWSRTGRKGPYAGYYVQIAPGSSFVGGGLWCPDAAPLASLRRAVDRHPERLKDVLMSPGIRKECLNGSGKDEKKCVKEFVKHNEGNMLKTKPKGFSADHKDIALMRLRNYTMGVKVKDEEIVGEKGLKRVAELVGVLQPFITYLNSVVMPDDPDASSDDDDDEEDEGEGDANGS
ncbi:hypothetical protein MMC25_002974 [Agyrium rufum]|nr:hypothetical protein [Agyrium rufum]